MDSDEHSPTSCLKAVNSVVGGYMWRVEPAQSNARHKIEMNQDLAFKKKNKK